MSTDVVSSGAVSSGAVSTDVVGGGAVSGGAVGTDEARRLAALEDYRLLDQPLDQELAAVVRLVVGVTGSRRATLNILDEARQCQLTTAGFDGADSPREDSMCAVHFLDGQLVHTPDAAADPRFAANPWVDGRLARVRSYASAPLVTAEGHALGTLCAFDEEPRPLTEEGLAGLRDLAAVVLALFERRREARRLERLAAEAEEARALVDLLLHEAESRQELTDAVLDTIDVAVVACDPQGHLTLFNQTAREWHGGYPDAELTFTEHATRYGLFEVDGTTPLPPDAVPLRRALVEGTVTGAEVAVTAPGREPITAVCSGRSLVASDGTLLGAVVAMADVTTDRAQRAELQRSNTDLEHFAAIAGHDLASPLSVVAGYLELIADHAGPQLDDRALGWVATVQASVGRMQALITSLLAYARAGAPTQHRPTGTQALAELALLDLATVLEGSGAQVVAEGLPEVDGDPVLLRQLLQNLLANAVKHRDPERALHVAVTAARTASDWEFAVADDGPGVPAEHREAVFEVFTTAGAQGGARNGHGIGLATCQRIVERHGGRIWVEQTPGGGATFRFTLPAADPA